MHAVDAIAWLMEGDPAIRWQTLRDLLAAPKAEWQAEQQQTITQGWGAQLLARQDADGRWGGGIYSPKWTSTTYTLLTLHDIGIPRDCAAAQQGARLVLNQLLGERCDKPFRERLAECDRCVVGMILRLVVYFELDDERVEAIVENLLAEMMPDGAWKKVWLPVGVRSNVSSLATSPKTPGQASRGTSCQPPSVLSAPMRRLVPPLALTNTH